MPFNTIGLELSCLVVEDLDLSLDWPRFEVGFKIGSAEVCASHTSFYAFQNSNERHLVVVGR